MKIDEPEHYSKNHDLQRAFATHVWDIFSREIDQRGLKRSFEKVIDFGCGTGDITVDLVRWITDLVKGESDG